MSELDENILLAPDLISKTPLERLKDEYTAEFTDLVEVVYGNNMLSQGGSECIELMFSGLDLNGKKVLDIGSGLGGVDNYLAQHYSLDIIGIDRVERLVEEANQRKKDGTYKGNLRYIFNDNDSERLDFNSNTFDIVFSKESILHVERKRELFQEIYRILKPGGTFICLDWMNESENYGPNTQEFLAADNLELFLITSEQYQLLLKQQGFKVNHYENLAKLFATYTQHNLDILTNKEKEIGKRFGASTLLYAKKSWQLQREAFLRDEITVGLIKAVKKVD